MLSAAAHSDSGPKAPTQLVSTWTWVVEAAASYPLASDLEDLFCAAHVKAALPLWQQHDCLALAAQASLAAVACQMTKVYQRGCLLLHHRLGAAAWGAGTRLTSELHAATTAGPVRLTTRVRCCPLPVTLRRASARRLRTRGALPRLAGLPALLGCHPELAN